MNALVSADEALERGEVPTVPHEGSPVLWAEWWRAHDGWRGLWRASSGGRPLSPEKTDQRGHWRESSGAAREMAMFDLSAARGIGRFGALSRPENSMERADSSPRGETP